MQHLKQTNNPPCFDFGMTCMSSSEEDLKKKKPRTYNVYNNLTFKLSDKMFKSLTLF